MIAESGLTVVVSPLVALMTDQVASLKAKGVHAALLAADAVSREETSLIQQQAADPRATGLRFLYVTPERVAKSKMLISRLQKAYLAGGLSRIAIDEAHCAAVQGHDFRPDYLSLGTLRASFPSVPILALTATASDAVRADVERTLGLDAGAGDAGWRVGAPVPLRAAPQLRRHPGAARRFLAQVRVRPPFLQAPAHHSMRLHVS